MRNVVLVHGDKSGIGKDFFTNHFVQALAQRNISTCAFRIAFELKKLCRRQFNGVLEDYEYDKDRSLRERPIEGINVKNVVDLWIKVGEFYRGLDELYWIKETASNIIKQGKTFSIISDFRFNCEWTYLNSLKELGVIDNIIVVKIVAPPGVGKQNQSDGLVSAPINYVVYNDFTDSFLRDIETLADSFANAEKC